MSDPAHPRPSWAGGIEPHASTAMRRGERQAYGLNGIGLGATVFALCVPQLWPRGPWYLWYGLLWVGIALIGIGIIVILSVRLSRRQWIYAFLSVLIISLGTGAWYYECLPDQTPL